MKITFLGASRQVTGSCFLLENQGCKILVDCGMEQGPDCFEKQNLSVLPSSIDCVLLTHAHIDHSGLLPLLYAEGFRGVIYCTSATKKLCSIMLRDAAHIQETEAEWKNRKTERRNGEICKPLYTMEDAENVMTLFRTHEYNESFIINRSVNVRFLDAGHLLGSAHIEITYEEKDRKQTVVFSGDIGNINRPLINNPTYIENADYVIMESTYGDRDHVQENDSVVKLAKIIQKTFDDGGNVIIPSFAVGRTQEILFYIRQIKERGLVTGHGEFTVYLDSPLAIEATNIFKNIDPSYYDEDTLALIQQGINPIDFPGLKLSVTSEDSKLINLSPGPHVIISASGMCEAGRIRHHLKHNLWKKNNTILFVGYQVDGTLGHTILSGAESVKLFGEIISVNANIMVLENSSAHADRETLIKWLSSLKRAPKKVFLVHGNDRSCEMLAEKIRQEYGYDAVCPYFGEGYDLEQNIKTDNAIKRMVSKRKSSKTGKATPFNKLLEALQRLTLVINESEGRANRDLEKFAKQIEAICDWWER
ncbi:MAG TPA: MBL fold metallo-hydrolase [Clostridia bacterium]|nr:MBL fold metallo-hydrolase [Clostridia bacterium]